ncbi:MAG TPA: VWA domain-containing protein [Pyrinomonadaceae bacterium]|nr:VWA domain-containing protein [Pyrinomonadaceae bacterium]
MKYAVLCSLLSVGLFATIGIAQSASQRVRRDSPQGASSKTTRAKSDTIKICQGVPIPGNYVVVAIESSPVCRAGAYVLAREDSQAAPALTAVAKRPRKVTQAGLELESADAGATPNSNEPTLKTPEAISLELPVKGISPSLEKSNGEEVEAGDVVRIDTNLVTVPVSVLDRQGRLIPNLQREQFKVFENDVEQQIVHFEPTEKPFTVALMLDTSGSTVFHLSEIKEAAIEFAKQLRPQDRVLVVTFDRLVMLLTEATSDLKVVTSVIDRNALTGFSTRLYDAVDIVITQRLNKIPGRKAIVLFTDGVDTFSYNATYKSTLHQVDEQEILIYPVQYDTSDYIPVHETEITSATTKTPGGSATVTETGPNSLLKMPGTLTADYEVASQYLQQLADKTGARLYRANDPKQLAGAFSRIAEELRSQYSLGYYPATPVKSGERRSIKVRVDQANIAVRARESYTRGN